MDTPLEQRLRAIDATGLVDGPPVAAFDRGARLAAALLGTTVTHTTLVLDDRQYYPSNVGLPEPVASARETPLSYSFCKHVVDDEAPLAFDDVREVARLSDNQAIAEFKVQTYIGVPLRAPDGTVIGTVCALDFVTRQWTDEEVGLLEDVADMLRTELTLRAEVERLRHLQEQRLATGLVATALRSEVAGLSGESDLAAVTDRLDALVEQVELLSRPVARD